MPDGYTAEVYENRRKILFKELRELHPGGDLDPQECPLCGWSVFAHAVSQYGLDCPGSSYPSPAARSGRLPSQRKKEGAQELKTHQNKRADILQTAENLVNGDRAQSYGPPGPSFSRIANLWAAMGFVVEDKGAYRAPNATDVAMALIQLKMARLVASPDHEDSWVDIAGYAGLGGELSIDD